MSRHGRIEELDLAPGQEREVGVWYCPSVVRHGSAAAGVGSSSVAGAGVGGNQVSVGGGGGFGGVFDKNLALLHQRTFRVFLQVVNLPYESQQTSNTLNEQEGRLGSTADEHKAVQSALEAARSGFRKVIISKAKVCTSFVEVPREVDLGECPIGSSTKGQLAVRNLSDLACKIKLEFASKILKVLDTASTSKERNINTTHDAIISNLQPRSTRLYALEISPMRINPNYCKQIRVENLSNRANDQFVNVRANNVDSNRVSLHNLFYLVRSRHPSNTIYFDLLVTNSPMIRSFTLKNITDKPITLDLSPSHPDAIRLFIEADGRKRAALSERSGMEKGGSMLGPVGEVVDEHAGKDLSTRGRSRWLSGRGEGGTRGGGGEGRDGTSSTTQDVRPTLDHTHDRQRQEERAISPPLSPPLVELPGVASTAVRPGGSCIRRSKSLGHISGSGGGARRAVGWVLGGDKKRPVRGDGSRRGRRGGAAEDFASPDAVSRLVPTGAGDSGLGPRKVGMGGWSKTTAWRVNAGKRERERRARDRFKGEGRFNGTWEELRSRFEASSFGQATRYFNTAEEERSYINEFEALTQALEAMIDCGNLAPAATVNIAAQSDVTLVCVFKAPNRALSADWLPAATSAKETGTGKIRSLECHVNIKLVDYDQETLKRAKFHRGRVIYGEQSADADAALPHFDIPVRTLPIIAKVCQSKMEVAQRHINFGTVMANHEYTKKLVVKNLSDVPLMYRIEKTKNWVAQAFMNFDDDDALGVVKPHGLHERDFNFHPKMSGKFHEVLKIRNLQDPDHIVEITVKALVRKRETYVVHPPALAFGVCKTHERSKTLRIELSNVTSTTRSVKLKHGALNARVLGRVLWLPDELLNVTYKLEKCTVEENKVNKEDELEHLERKLKIYVRKGKQAKAAKLREKIQELLGKPIVDTEGGSALGVFPASPDTTDNSDSHSTASEASAWSDADLQSEDESDAEGSDSEWEALGQLPRRRRRAHWPADRSGVSESEGQAEGDNQCVATIPPQGVQTILVHMMINFTAASLREWPVMEGEGVGLALGEVLPTDVPLAEVAISGSLLTHERANQDHTKLIQFSLTWDASEDEFLGRTSDEILPRRWAGSGGGHGDRERILPELSKNSLGPLGLPLSASAHKAVQDKQFALDKKQVGNDSSARRNSRANAHAYTRFLSRLHTHVTNSNL